MRARISSFINRFIKLLPIILAVFLALVYLGLFLLNQKSLMIRASFYILPVAAITIIYFLKLRHSSHVLDTNNTDNKVINLRIINKSIALFFITQLLCADFVILNNERTWLYFFSLILGIIIITYQILGNEHDLNKSKGTIIFEIIILYLNIVLSQTLILPLYFGSTDPLNHMSLINSILDTGRLTSTLDGYQQFPLFHIWGTIGILITGLKLQIAYFLIYTLAFSITIVIIYLFTNKLTQNKQISLISALLYSISQETIFAGMGVTTRVFCFIIIVLLFWLIFSNENKYRFLTIITIVPLILIHQSSTIQSFVFIIILMTIEFIYLGKTSYFNTTFIILFCIAFLGYWIFAANFVFNKLISTLISTTELAVLPDVSSITKPFLSAFFGNFDQSIILFFCLIGIITTVIIKGYKKDILIVVLVFALIALFLYIDSPIQYLAYLLLTGRLPLIISPFVMLAMALGFGYFISKKSVNIILCGLFIVVYGISSILILGNSTDLNLSKIFGNDNDSYFKSSEISALDYAISIDSNGNSVPVFTDWQASRYIQSFSNTNNSSLISSLTNTKSAYYFVLRDGELNDRHQLKFSDLPQGSPRSVGVTLNENEVIGLLKSENDQIYKNTNCTIYYTPDK